MKYHAWHWTAAVLTAAAVVAPAPAEAQDQPVVRRRWVERAPVAGERLMKMVIQRRARLGLNVSLRARESDSLGAFVEAVTPGGPADKAGIRSADIITKVDGKAVIGAAAPDAAADESLPGLRLIELAAKLEPNDTVAVELRRGDQRQTVSVVAAGELEDVFVRGYTPGRRFGFHLGPDHGPMAHLGELDGNFEAGPMRRFFFGSPLGRLELAPLNPDLGRYFGANEGVLVISVPPKSTLGLKGGDVVLAVDGRKPSGPAHLLRILRSYERGESFKLDVLRNRKRETVTGRLREGRGERDGKDGQEVEPADGG